MEFIIGLIIYFLISIGIYLIAKTMEYQFSFGAFIPIVNLYIIIDLAGFGVGMFMLFFILGLLIYIHIIFLVIYLLFYAFIIFSFGTRTLGNIFITILSIFLPFIGFPIMGFLMRKKYLKAEENKKDKKIIICNGCKKKIRINKKINEFNCPSCGVLNIAT